MGQVIATTLDASHKRTHSGNSRTAVFSRDSAFRFLAGAQHYLIRSLTHVCSKLFRRALFLHVDFLEHDPGGRPCLAFALAPGGRGGGRNHRGGAHAQHRTRIQVNREVSLVAHSEGKTAPLGAQRPADRGRSPALLRDL